LEKGREYAIVESCEMGERGLLEQGRTFADVFAGVLI